MSEVFKDVVEAEAKAKEIIDRAKEEAELIKRDAESRLSSVYKEVYEKTMKELPEETAKMIKETKKLAEEEAEKAQKETEKEAARLKSMAEKKIDKIADEIFKELTKI